MRSGSSWRSLQNEKNTPASAGALFIAENCDPDDSDNVIIYGHHMNSGKMFAALNKFTEMNNKKFGDKAYIKWNFTKFLIDREGRVIARFEPTVDMKDVRNAVETALRA